VRLPFVGEPSLIEEGVRRLARAWEIYSQRGASECDLQVVV
jgi:hypothetical protein